MTPVTPDRVTQRAIAKALGISHSTVSLALRDSPKVSLARRQEVQQHAQSMGYQPDAIAIAFAHRKRAVAAGAFNATIAWINQQPESDAMHGSTEVRHYWRGAQKAAERNGFKVEEFVCRDQKSLARLEKILLARGIRCIILPPHPVGSCWEGFSWENFFAVRLGRSIQHPALHIVTSDQVANSILACQEIRRRGYKRIGFVTADTLENGQRFKAGFLMAQSELQSGEPMASCMVTTHDVAEDRRRLARWLETTRLDAILSDASWVPEILADLGYKIPAGIGLATTSWLPDGSINAGIDQHPEEIGRAAVLLAISQMHDHAYGVPPIVRLSLVEGSWVDGSMLPARANGSAEVPNF